MTVMQQYVNHYITPTSWQEGCVHGWSFVPMSLDFWRPLGTLGTYSVSLSADPMWLITFLWWYSCPGSLMLRQQQKWDGVFCFGGLQYHLFCPGHVDPLHVYVCPHSEDALIWRTSEGLFRLCFSPHCCVHLLWDRCLHVLTAQLPPFQGHRQNGNCVLRYSRSYAESTWGTQR